jgi:hypothetical protein
VPPVGFEPRISAGERPKTYALDRAATGAGNKQSLRIIKGLINSYFEWICLVKMEVCWSLRHLFLTFKIPVL